MSENLFSAFNYLVPATGTVQGFNIQTDFALAPYSKNFQQLSNDAQEFHPSGIFIDNTQGKAALTILIKETGQSIVTAAGVLKQTQFPAPPNITATITSGSANPGDGIANVTFVDFPVMPFESSVSVATVTTAFASAPVVTRPANVTPYTANDVIGNGPTGALNAVIEFAAIGNSGGGIILTGADLAINVAAIPAGMTSFRLYLYDATPASALADNAPWDLPAGDRANFLGYIDIGAIVDIGSTLFVQATGINQQFKLAAGKTSLWGYLVTNGAFTPAGNSEIYMPRLRAVGL